MRKVVSVILAIVVIVGVLAVSDKGILFMTRFKQFKVVDNENFSLTLKELNMKDGWNCSAIVDFKNKSNEATYYYYLDSISVNGVMIDNEVSGIVPPNKSEQCTIDFFSLDLVNLGIEKATDLELSVIVLEEESGEVVSHETVHVYPYSKKNATLYNREIKTNDIVLVDNNEISIFATAETGFNELNVYEVYLYLVNKTDHVMKFQTQDVSVNGSLIDPLYREILLPNKRKISVINWYKSDFEEKKISDVEEIVMNIVVSDLGEIKESGPYFAFAYLDYETDESIYQDTLTIHPR